MRGVDEIIPVDIPVSERPAAEKAEKDNIGDEHVV